MIPAGLLVFIGLLVFGLVLFVFLIPFHIKLILLRRGNNGT